MQNFKKYLAECVGTAVLVLFGCGVAVLTGDVVATSLAFGLSIVMMALTIGNVSGCHINPAVSLGVFLSGRMSLADMIGYMIAQVAGGFVGSLLLALFVGHFYALGGNEASGLLVDSYGEGGSLIVALAVELILTFLFVYLILKVTDKDSKVNAGLAIGAMLTFVHLIGIGLTGTSVNPARSIAPAVLQAFTGNTDALAQIWIFIVGPLAGGALAAIVYRLVHKNDAPAKAEETEEA